MQHRHIAGQDSQTIISTKIFSGELHVPLEVCGAVVKHELDYWQIKENHIKSCCWRNYRSYIEDKRILDSFNRSVLKRGMCKYDDEGLQGWEKFRTRVWMLLEYPRTSTAAMVWLFVCLFVLRFNFPVKNFSLMSGRRPRVPGFNQYFGGLMCCIGMRSQTNKTCT